MRTILKMRTMLMINAFMMETQMMPDHLNRKNKEELALKERCEVRDCEVDKGGKVGGGRASG